MAAEMVQMNVRIPRALKVAGDEALASAGFTPSEVVRAVWEKAARRGKDLAEVIGALRGKDEKEPVTVDTKAIEPVLSAQRAITEGMKELGVDLGASQAPVLSYDELREMAYLERLQEKGLM